MRSRSLIISLVMAVGVVGCSGGNENDDSTNIASQQPAAAVMSTTNQNVNGQNLQVQEKVPDVTTASQPSAVQQPPLPPQNDLPQETINDAMPNHIHPVATSPNPVKPPEASNAGEANVNQPVVSEQKVLPGDDVANKKPLNDTAVNAVNPKGANEQASPAVVSQNLDQQADGNV